MSPNEVNADAPSQPKPRPWQFGLHELLFAFVGVSIWCAIASWSLAWAVVFGATTLYLCGLMALDRKRRISLGAWLIALCPPGFVLYYMPALLNDDAEYECTVELVLTVKDGKTRQPVADVPIECWADDTSISISTSASGIASFEASVPGKRRNLGWGRSRLEANLKGVSVLISAPGYEATYIDCASRNWNTQSSQTESSLLTTEVFLKPMPSIVQPEPSVLDSL